MEWIACRVATGKEFLVRAKIKQLSPEAEIMVPRKEIKQIKDGVVKTTSEKMLPGYLLIGTETPLDTFILREFVKIVGKVTPEEIALLRAQEGQKEDTLDVGTKILVIEGPFKGSKGEIREWNKNGSMKCTIDFQGIEVKANMKPELIASLQ